MVLKLSEPCTKKSLPAQRSPSVKGDLKHQCDCQFLHPSVWSSSFRASMLCHVQAMMELLSDSVPNVRLSALGLLPALKQTIRLPEDVQQLVSFECCSLSAQTHACWHVITGADKHTYATRRMIHNCHQTDKLCPVHAHMICAGGAGVCRDGEVNF